MSKQKSNLKRVKIDDHIKQSRNKSNVAEKPKRPRGRPRLSESGSTASELPGNSNENIINHQSTIDHSIETDAPSRVVPQYDTTAEAKAFIQSPFEVMALFLSTPELALTPEEVEAALPATKVFYDKRVLPKLGENGDIIQFAMVMTVITASKVKIVMEKNAKSRVSKFGSENKGENLKPQSVQNPIKSEIVMPTVTRGNA